MKNTKLIVGLLIFLTLTAFILFVVGLKGFPVGGGHIPLPTSMILFFKAGWIPALLWLIHGIYLIIRSRNKLWLVSLAVSGFCLVSYLFLAYAAIMLHIG